MATTEDELFHIGTPHDGVIPHSGRFPYGSGVNAFQHPKDFYTYVAGLRKDGLSDEEIRIRMSGHLCRCTGYENIFRAVKKTMMARLADNY